MKSRSVRIFGRVRRSLVNIEKPVKRQRQKIRLVYLIFMVLKHLRLILLSSFVSIMQMKSYNNSFVVTYSNWNKRNINVKNLIGQKSNFMIINHVLTSLKINLVFWICSMKNVKCQKARIQHKFAIFLLINSY